MSAGLGVLAVAGWDAPVATLSLAASPPRFTLPPLGASIVEKRPSHDVDDGGAAAAEAVAALANGGLFAPDDWDLARLPVLNVAEPEASAAATATLPLCSPGSRLADVARSRPPPCGAPLLVSSLP